MTIDRHLKHLAQKDPENRQKALLDVLIQEGLEFSLQEQEPSIQNPRGIRNYLLTPWSPEPSLLFCAHYDAVPGTFGANDNAAAVCILITLFPYTTLFRSSEERRVGKESKIGRASCRERV